MINSLLNDDKLKVIRDCVLKTRTRPGDMAELGVYQGGTAKMISDLVPEKVLHLFDTFEGVPEDDLYGAHQKGDFAANLDAVKVFLKDNNISFHPGIFPATATGEVFSFVHLDADTYQSTKAGIEYFWHRLSQGGIIVFDDYKWRDCPGVERAINECLPGIPLLRTVHNQAWAVKSPIFT